MSRFSLARTLLASLLAICFLGLSVPAKSETLTATSAGAIAATGQILASGPGAFYQTGREGGFLYRGFLVFDIPSGLAVTGATLRLNSGPTVGAPHTISLWSVETNASGVISPQVAEIPNVYTDLGSGTAYGTLTVTASGENLEITLPAAAIAHINGKLGGRFVVGFNNDSVGPADSYTFAGFDTTPRELVLTRATPVPTLSEWAMGGLLALLALGGATLLHRQRRASAYRQA